jgi:peptidoglycan/xylan/chitin deacetylase (PgdA/CDA1 family)
MTAGQRWIQRGLLALVGVAVTAVVILAYVHTKAPGDVKYVVKAGDNLYAIARRYHTTSSALAALNSMPHKNAIRPGQELVVPGRGRAPKRPPKAVRAQVIKSGPPSPVVAFSFDAGSDAGYTDQILRILNANAVIASFGVTGVWADRNPDLLRRIVAHGHHLINHSTTHVDFRTLSRSARRDEIDKAESTIIAITGLGTKPYFRPPYGAHDSATISPTNSVSWST